jgi:membrane-bound metal-dependent hydrolase YbcI (DUF457 family)
LPSPIVHSLAGLAQAPLARAPRRLFFLAALVFAGNAPDLDFLPGVLIGDPTRFHHGAAHSLMGALIFAALMLPLARRAGVSSLRFAALMALAYAGHLGLDMLSADDGVRNGVPVFWPLSWVRLSWPIAIFTDIRVAPGVSNFVRSVLLWHNLFAVTREIAVMALAGLAVALWRRVGAARL